MNDDLKEYHREHLKSDTVGYMTCGGENMAVCEEIEFFGLDEV